MSLQLLFLRCWMMILLLLKIFVVVDPIFPPIIPIGPPSTPFHHHPLLNLSFFAVDEFQRILKKLIPSPSPSSSFSPIITPLPSNEKRRRRHFHHRTKTKVKNKRKGSTSLGIRNETSELNFSYQNLKRSPSFSKDLHEASFTWSSVVILDEKKFQDDIDSGRTKIHILPNGRLVSAFLSRGVNGRFLFLNPGTHLTSVAAVVIPCTSSIALTISHLPKLGSNTTKFYVELSHNQLLENWRTQRTVSYYIEKAVVGVYMLQIRAIHADTYLQIYMTLNDADSHDPFDALNPKNGTTRAQFHDFLNLHQPFLNKPWVGVKLLRGHRVQVKWDTSPINPHRTHYCISANSGQDFSSLCGAQRQKFGTLPPDLRDLPIYPLYPQINNHEFGDDNFTLSTSTERTIGSINQNEIIVGCIRKKTNYIFTDLVEGQLYFFNVFVRDMLTGLSFPYVRTMFKYLKPKVIHNQLQDGRALKVRLNSTYSVSLKFNIKKSCGDISMYIMPCGGGSLNYKISESNNSRVLFQVQEVDSLDIVKIAFPLPGKYVIDISTKNDTKELVARMAEVLVSKKLKKFPLPVLPVSTKVVEILAERGCDSIVLQWWSSPDPRDDEYCLFLKEENRKRDDFNFKKPNQCDVERSLQNDPYVSYSLCVQKRLMPTIEKQEKLVSQKISGLEPGRVFIVQVIVRRHRGKALSYDLTYASTKKECEDDNWFSK